MSESKKDTRGRISNPHRVVFEGVTSLHALIMTAPRLWLRVASYILKKKTCLSVPLRRLLLIVLRQFQNVGGWLVVQEGPPDVER